MFVICFPFYICIIGVSALFVSYLVSTAGVKNTMLSAVRGVVGDRQTMSGVYEQN